MPDAKHIAKSYFYNLLLTLANLLFPILSFPYVSRVLGPEGIGKVQFVFSFAQYFALIASIGIPIYGMKEIARCKGDLKARSRIFSELITIYVVTCTLLSLVYFWVTSTFSYFAVNKAMYHAAALLILLGFTNIEWLYSGLEDFRSIALRSFAFKIIGLFLLYFFVKERSDFNIYLYLLIFSYLGNNTFSLFLLKRKVKLVFVDLNFRRHLIPLLFILGTTLAASMYTDMDTVLLGFLSDKKTIGLYTAAVKLSKITIPFITSMNVIMMPKMGKDFAEHNIPEVEQTLCQTFSFVMFFGVPIAFGLALLAPEFIALFSGFEFLPAANSMRLLAILPLIIGLAHFLLFMVLVPSGHNKEMFVCVLGGLITSVILNILLVPAYKEVGSSIANVGAEVVVTALYFYFIKKHFSFKYRWRLALEAFLSALIFIPLIYAVKALALSLIYNIVLSVATCTAAYVIVQMFVFKSNFIYEVVNFLKVKISKAE